MKRWALLGAVAGGMVVGLGVGWRELGWRRELADRTQRVAQLEQELAVARAGEAAQAAQAGQCAVELDGARTGLQSLADRVANLEAQRDHLRAEGERQSLRAAAAETALGEANAALAQARHELLEAQAEPRALRVQVEQAQRRLAELEAAFDERASFGMEGPAPFEYAGSSLDSTVFAVRGEVADPAELPYAVLLCRRDRVVLEGWLHRFEGEVGYGHVARWREPASALVNGEKVFMFRTKSHEAVP